MNRRLIVPAMLAAAVAACSSPTAPPASHSLAGKWYGVAYGGGSCSLSVTLALQDNAGTLSGPGSVVGCGDSLSITVSGSWTPPWTTGDSLHLDIQGDPNDTYFHGILGGQSPPTIVGSIGEPCVGCGGIITSVETPLTLQKY